MTVRILQGDCREVLATLPVASVDAVVCDPPYELGFMGKGWDSTGVAYDLETWRQALRVLKPGGHLLAFSGTRTYHRMVCAIEDAGFEIRDQIGWVYGSGFPKSLDVSKAIDKAAGLERPDAITGGHMGISIGGGDPRNDRAHELHNVGNGINKGALFRGTPVSDAARQWQGWGTALKPAWEPIVLARKPLSSGGTDVRRNVECELRARGFFEEIRWRKEDASVVVKKGSRTTSSSTAVQQRQAEASAGRAAESGMLSAATLNASGSEPTTLNGEKPTASTFAATQSESARSCETTSSAHTASSAPAAVSENEPSLPSITSTVEERCTEGRSTERSTSSSSGSDFPLDTEPFAGIATGLTGSMATVRIERAEDGCFLWPRGLPEFIRGAPLTVAANVLQHGTGALNIDGCRVPGPKPATTRGVGDRDGWGMQAQGRVEDDGLGRWPANVIHDGSDEVLAAFPWAGGAAAPVRGTEPTGHGFSGNVYGAPGAQGRQPSDRRDGGGSAARFFYCAKADRADRHEGLDDPGAQFKQRSLPRDAENVERQKRGNHHPTVKPTDLMRYLCRLVTPPGGTVLDPFMGSGSTLKAAELEGFSAIGIELDPEYIAIARRRIAADAPLFAEVV